MDVQPSQSASAQLPWVEKYRPKRLADVVGNAVVVAAFDRFVEHRALPNLILAGPPGVGKTTSLECLTRELYGKDRRSYVLTLNASDERGVEVVRESIVKFARTTRPSKELLKVVILDEADSMTPAAQQSLRSVMENFSESTRFAFAVNDMSKMIQTIQSRCAIFRFSPLTDREILDRLTVVCGAEKVSFDEAGLSAIVFAADGDLRPALNSLQATSVGFDRVTEAAVYSICDVPHPATIKTVLEDCLEGAFYKANRSVTKLYDKGYAAEDLVKTMMRLVKRIEMDEDAKILFLEHCAVAHLRVLDGLTGKLQLAALLARLCQSAGARAGE